MENTAYRLERVTVRANNTTEGMERIEALWEDITSGKLPILFDSAHEFQPGISPVRSTAITPPTRRGSTI